MDTIERSNLNRQLLFRQQHIGMPKASVAAKEVTNINPYIAVHGMTNKLDAETEALFDGNFWEKIDLVTTALDNINARKYVDEQCIKYKKYLIDSGTLGTKGNTQVVIPGISDSYSSTADPPDDAVPLCTLKSFPYLPEHCVAWAKSIFVQHYYNDVNSISSFISRIEQGTFFDFIGRDHFYYCFCII